MLQNAFRDRVVDAAKKVADTIGAQGGIKDSPIISLPGDAGKSINARALQWLDSYGIIRDEIIYHDLRWSELRQQLIFPIRGVGKELLAFVGRNFGQGQSKWTTYGHVRSIVHLVYPRPVVAGLESPVVVVEDVVSAIKVGRHVCAVPLFGSHCGPEKLSRLRHMTKKIIFWLDPDKYVDAMSAAKRSQLLGMDTHVIYSEKDPKEHSDEEILNFTRL